MDSNLPHSLVRWLACVGAAVASAVAFAQPVYTVFSDAIPYASWSGVEPRMDAVWTRNTGGMPAVVAEPAPSTNRYFTLANSVIERPLGITLTNNFDVRIEALHGAFARAIWVGLFNSAGTQGYGFFWDSSSSSTSSFVSLRRWNVGAPSDLLFNTGGTALGASASNLGRSPVSGPFAQFRLTWNKTTSTLKLFVDGVERLSRTDSSFTTFSRLFISGNGSSTAPARFDNVIVATTDESPPSVELTSPSDGASLAGAAKLSAHASDDIGIAGVQFQLDGENLGAELVLPPYSIDWDTDSAAPGLHVLTAIARDIAGNTKVSAPVNVSVAGYARLGAVADAYVRAGEGQASRNFGDDPELRLGGPIQDAREICLKFDVSGVVNVGRGVLRLFGGAEGAAEPFVAEVHSSSQTRWTEPGVRWVNKPEAGAGAPSSAPVQAAATWHEWDVTSLLQQEWNAGRTLVTLIVRAVGGTATVAAFHSREHAEHPPQLLVIPDRTPPSVAITRPANGDVVSRIVPISAVASDNREIAGVQFKLDGANLGAEQVLPPFSYLWNSEMSPTGRQVLTAVVRDAAGNRTESEPVHVLVARSTTLPVIADAHVDAAEPSRNFGTEPLLKTSAGAPPGSGEREIYLKFNLSNVGPIGYGALRLFGSSSSAEPASAGVYSAAATNWHEHGVRWVNRPDVGATVHATTPLDGAPAWHAWDITSLLQAERSAGRDFVTLVVRGAGPAAAESAFHSRENALHPPHLVVAVLPPDVAPVAHFEAEAFSAMSGVVAGPEHVGGLQDGDWIRFNAVNLGEGNLTFQARVASSNAPADYGLLEVRLGSPDGERIAALRVLDTGGEAAWEVQTAAVQGGVGTHDVYVLARGGNGASVCSLDWIKLRRDLLPRGATMPFVTYEAESGTFTGSLNGSSDGFHRYGASGRAYVWLAATDQHVQWTARLPATRLTLRYGIPLGTNGTISVFVNDTLHVVNVSAVHCYDAAAIASKPRRYDEVTIPVNVSAGDVVKVQKRAADSLVWYAIDLIDLELAPPPAPAPEGFLSITAFGATPDDLTDDRAAIEACIAAAADGARKVYFPAGTFRTGARIAIPSDFEVRGAGLWHTTLHSPTPSTQFANQTGFFIGTNARLSDMKLTGVSNSRPSGTTAVVPNGAKGFVLENLHVQNTGDLIGWSAYHDAVIRNCRIIGTYFDGIHLGDGPCTRNVVENCFFRGLGDDAVAQVNRADFGLCFGNVAQFNTVIASYWGRGMAAIGGDTFTIRDNLIDGSYHAGVMIATEPLGPSFSRPIRGLKVQRTTIFGCGHAGHNHAGLHFWLSRSPMENVRIEDCRIEAGETRGVRIDNTPFGDENGRTQFNYNTAAGNAQGGYNDASMPVVPVLTGNAGF